MHNIIYLIAEIIVLSILHTISIELSIKKNSSMLIKSKMKNARQTSFYGFDISVLMCNKFGGLWRNNNDAEIR